MIIYDNIQFNNDDEFNRYLLFKYLKLEYISRNATIKQAEKSAQELIIKNKDNLFDYHGLAFNLGATSLEYFSLYFLQDIFIGDGKSDIAPIHTQIWKECQDTILNKSNT